MIEGKKKRVTLAVIGTEEDAEKFAEGMNIRSEFTMQLMDYADKYAEEFTELNKYLYNHVDEDSLPALTFIVATAFMKAFSNGTGDEPVFDPGEDSAFMQAVGLLASKYSDVGEGFVEPFAVFGSAAYLQALSGKTLFIDAEITETKH